MDKLSEFFKQTRGKLATLRKENRISLKDFREKMSLLILIERQLADLTATIQLLSVSNTSLEEITPGELALDTSDFDIEEAFRQIDLLGK